LGAIKIQNFGEETSWEAATSNIEEGMVG